MFKSRKPRDGWGQHKGVSLVRRQVSRVLVALIWCSSDKRGVHKGQLLLQPLLLTACASLQTEIRLPHRPQRQQAKTCPRNGHASTLAASSACAHTLGQGRSALKWYNSRTASHLRRPSRTHSNSRTAVNLANHVQTPQQIYPRWNGSPQHTHTHTCSDEYDWALRCRHS